MINPFIRDWDITRSNNNLYVVKTFHLSQINICNYAKIGNNLIGNILQQTFTVFNSYNLVGIIFDSDIYVATISIGKAAYPFEVFVSPALLIFYILSFGCL